MKSEKRLVEDLEKMIRHQAGWSTHAAPEGRIQQAFEEYISKCETSILVAEISNRTDATILGMSFKEALDRLREVQFKKTNWTTPILSDALLKSRVEMRDACDEEWKEGKLIAIHPHDDPNAPEYNGEPDYYCEDEYGEIYPYLYCRIKKIDDSSNLQKEIDRLQSVLDAEINTNKDMSLRECELIKIVERCGGWKTEDGHWVQGFDTVEYSSGDNQIAVRNIADKVPSNQRHLYSKAIICSKCGTVMWTTDSCGTFCRECDARVKDNISCG